MTASHGGKAQHDQSDAQTIAVLLHGGRRPQTAVYPAAMRATRALLRRRFQRTRQRAELLPHVQQPNWQDNRPEIGQQRAYQANWPGVAERFPQPAVQKRGAVDLALIDDEAQRLHAVELRIVHTAKPHHAQPLDRLPAVPGIGKMLSVVLRDELHDRPRIPRVQDVVSAGRLVNCAKASAGNRSGTSGAKIGPPSRQWALSEAAGRLLRHNPAAQHYLARLEPTHGQGHALPLVAHQWARAGYDRLTRNPVFARQQFLRFCRKIPFWRQNLNIGYRKFNSLQPPKR